MEGLGRGQKQDHPKVENSSAPMAPSGGAASQCPGPPLSQRVAKSSEGKQRLAVEKVSLEVSADTHIHVRVFKIFGLF